MTKRTPPLQTVQISLLQSRAFPTRSEAMANLDRQIALAAAAGSKIICTQELCLDEYFCRRQDPDLFNLAEAIPGPLTEHYSSLARQHAVVLVLSLFEKCAPGLCYNTAVILDADGTMLGKYRKMHIPQDPGFEEKFYFAPGDLGFQAFTTAYGRIGVIICWDQWFPEAARLTALKGAELILCPTAIGGLECEGPALAAQQLAAWLNVQQAHAVANGCYYAAVNRTGREGETSFWGSSFCCDFYGEFIAKGSDREPEIVTARCDFAALEEHRRMWPFFRDRRIDAYSHISRRFDA
ncbi:MAG: carbon-nitrogen hydrolase [Lentisphaerae bacterium]|nr:carbon-nitrogen hydrolase [Lentisphaerota bacterium]